MPDILIKVSIQDGEDCYGCPFVSQLSYRDTPHCVLFVADLSMHAEYGPAKCKDCIEACAKEQDNA